MLRSICSGLFPRELTNQIYLGFAIGRAVGAQHLVKPHRRLTENIRMLP